MSTWLKKHYILLAIFLFATLLRLAFLGRLPAGFSPDEASQAYTAYSLLKTGRDEWGTAFPLTAFRSFADYKAPLQTYLMIPTIALFGLNEFAARLPSALFGILAVLAVYLLSNELFPRTRLGRFSVGHLAAFFLAISPWHLQFSRTALEVNLASVLFPLGLYFFLIGLKSGRHLSLAALFFGLNLYVYHAAKLFTPLFVLGLLLLFLKKIFKLNPKQLLLAGLIFLLFLLPAFYSTFFGPAGKRGSDLLLSRLNSQEQEAVLDQASFSPLARLSPFLPRLFSNSFTFTLDKFSENYISYYSPSFWFTEGGREVTYSVIPGRGLLYLWQLPLILLALATLAFINQPALTRSKKILFLWLLLAALPAALTHEGYRPNRAGSFLGLWAILTAFGLILAFRFFPRFKKVLGIFVVSLISILFIFYLNDYLFLSPIKYPNAISYGWRNTLKFVRQVEGDYDRILINPQGQTQAFVAFYLQIPPAVFQKESLLWWSRFQQQPQLTYLDQLGEYDLDKFSFQPLNWPEDINSASLYISHLEGQLLPDNRHTLFTVQTPKRDKNLIEVFDFRN